MKHALYLLVAMAAPVVACAQNVQKDPPYPTKAIRIVVGFAPGGTPDIQARMLGDKLGQRLGQSVVIDNRPGASGSIGMESVTKAPADGYTMVLAPVGPWAASPHLYKLSYDVLTDFAPIIHVATTPGVLVVHPSLPAKTVKGLIELARRKPGELVYASSGVGGFNHMSAELFSLMTKTRMTHVPYKSSGPALTDLIGGHIQLSFASAIPTVPHLQSGKLRALATTGAQRIVALPDLPTIAEAGVPGYESSTWSAIGAPARTPRPIIDRLNREFNAILQLPDIQQKQLAAGSISTGGTPEQFHEILKSELAKLGKLIKEAGIKADAGG